MLTNKFFLKNFFSKKGANMGDCIFCSIIAGEIPAERVYEDDSAIVIRDINPQAPHHFLVIPKKHYPSVHDIPEPEVSIVMGGLTNAICIALVDSGLDNAGYRLVVNSGDIAGQTVPHLHVHILGGRELKWPPG
jgi:histidine triad (HIT) family protein